MAAKAAKRSGSYRNNEKYQAAQRISWRKRGVSVNIAHRHQYRQY